MDWVTRHIALSGYPNAKTDLSIFTSILNVDQHTPYVTSVPVVHLPLIDGPGNLPALLAEAARKVELLQREGKILVHCAAGSSRSPFVLALYFAWHDDMEFYEALDFVAERRKSKEIRVDTGLLTLAEPSLALLRKGQAK